jgi:hypothetical protein
MRLNSALVVFSCAVALAQTPDTARINGRVLDPQQSGISGALVTAKDAGTGLERSTKTGAGGDFTIGGMPVNGRYTVSASSAGFVDAQVTGLTLIGGTTATVTIHMTIAAPETQIIVSGVAGELQTDQPQIGTLLNRAQIEQVPALNRKLTYLPLLNAANRPAINQGDIFMNQFLFTTNGAGRRQTWFEVDGAGGNDLWGRQTIFSSLPIDAVQEMDVLANAFSAEYGGSTGSVVNIVTRSGSREFHGDVLELWRPSGPEAKLSGFNATNATSGNQLTNDTLGQSAVSLSGPVGRAGSTQFFTAGEFSRQDRASPVTSPLSPGNFIGHYRGWLATFRLDHQFNEANNLFLHSSADGFRDTNPNGIVGGNSLPSVARLFRRRTYSEELGETAIFSPTLLNNIRLQFQLASPITQFDPVINGTQYQVPISTGGTFTTGTSQSASLQNRQYQIADTVSAVWGKHQVRLGGDEIHARNGGNSKEFGGPIYLGQFVYNTCTQPLSFCESPAYLNNIVNVRSYTQSYGDANYLVADDLWALFVQDDWHIRPTLTINLGLRYERQSFTDASKNFAPRVGFAWNVRGDGETVIRGGFGIYYSQIVDDSAANWALSGINGVFNYTASPGQIGFPASVSAAPLPAFPAGAVAPVKSIYLRPGQTDLPLIGYQNKLLSPYSEQWTFGVERRLARDWVLAADYVGSHTLKINRPLDVDPPAPFIRTQPNQIRSAQAANCTRPYWTAWYAQHGLACNPLTSANPQPPYSVIQSDANNGFAYYDALDVNLSHRFASGFTMLASYTWSHAMDNVDPDVPGQNPNDPNFTGKVEKGNAIFDQRHRFVLSGFYTGPWKITFGGITTLAAGLPYNIVTGTVNSGDTGATTDRPVINGAVVGRNTGRGHNIYEVSPYLERPFTFGAERFHVVLRAEAFNVFNHANFVGYSGTWGNGLTAGPGFGQPLAGITSQLPARSMQFSVRVGF